MKLALCKNNSEWGVQTFPMRENEYDIGITFDSEEIKQDYLSKKIFWPNYFDEIKKHKSLTKINTMRTADSTTFRLTLAEINDYMIPKDSNEKPLWTETQDSVLNKDFMASLDENTGLIKYWAISVSNVALNLFEFNAKLDEFANYDVRQNWKHSRQSHISQATTQDYYKDDKGLHTLNGLNNWNSVSEDFDDFDDKMYIPNKVEDINFDYSDIIVNGKDNPNYSKINDYLNSPKNWKIAMIGLIKKTDIEKNLHDGRGEPNDTIKGTYSLSYLKSSYDPEADTDDKNNPLGFLGLAIGPVSYRGEPDHNGIEGYIDYSIWDYAKDSETPYYTIVFDNDEIYQLLVHSDYTYSIEDLPYFPIQHNSGDKLFDWKNDTIKSTDPNNWKGQNNPLTAVWTEISNVSVDDLVDKIWESSYFGDRKLNWDDNNLVYLSDSLESLFNNGPETEEIKWDINWDNITNNQGKFTLKSKTKLLKSPYQKIRLRGTNDTDFDIRYEFMNSDSFKLKFGIIPNMDNIFISAKIIPMNPQPDTLYTGTNNDFRTELAYKEMMKANNILSTNAYQQMMSNEQNSINQQAKINKQNLTKDEILGPLKTIGSTLFGGIGGGLSKEHTAIKTGMGIAGGLINGASDMYSSLLGDTQSIGSFNAKIEDAKESPNKMNGDGLQLFVARYTTSVKPQLIWLSLPQANINKIGFHFHKYGEKLDIDEDINKFLDTHKYWDYIKANDLFEIFDRELSTQIRQNICGAMARGITIFHIREDWESTFKGIRYYDTANPQMSEELIGSFKDWE